MPTQFLAAQVVVPNWLDSYDEDVEAYYVSTINRESDILPDDMYSETIIWRWDIRNQKKGEIVYMTSHGRDSVWRHQQLVTGLEMSGMKYIEDINNQE